MSSFGLSLAHCARLFQFWSTFSKSRYWYQMKVLSKLYQITKFQITKSIIINFIKERKKRRYPKYREIEKTGFTNRRNCNTPRRFVRPVLHCECRVKYNAGFTKRRSCIILSFEQLTGLELGFSPNQDLKSENQNF